MNTTRSKTFVKYVVPTILGQVSFSLFTVMDGIFIGRGVGTNALGVVNIVMPFVMIVNAVYAHIDWLLIFPIRWGLKGAVIATDISQTIALEGLQPLFGQSYYIDTKYRFCAVFSGTGYKAEPTQGTSGWGEVNLARLEYNT